MAGFQTWVGMGNLTRDPDLKFISSGTALCKFGMAINRIYYKKDQSKGEEVLFINCVAWSKLGERIAEYLKKGSKCLVQGRLQSSSWTDDQGTKKSKIEILVESVQFLGKPQGQPAQTKTQDEGPEPQGDVVENPNPQDEEVPF